MKRKILFVGLASLFVAGLASAFNYMPAPQKSYYSQSVWRDRDRIVIPAQGFELQNDAIITVDELVLKGPLYTNGHNLHIDALQITFEPGGAIRAFSKPAPTGETRSEGAPGAQATGEQGLGGNGSTPSVADPGVDGLQTPGAMVIYAGRFVGSVVIDGTGQAGGQGGHGGKGGKGGRGGPGRNASANCLSWIGGDENRATNGGPGGQGAPGGQGGPGGRGGAAVPVVVISGEALPSTADVVSKPGAAGLPGEAGLPGDRGDGGPGGHGDSKGCGFWPAEWTSSLGGGAPGPQGPDQTETLGAGVPGSPGPVIDVNSPPLSTFQALVRPSQAPGVIEGNLATLEKLRFQLVDAWSQFHWARSYEFLILDTLSQIHSSSAVSFSDFSEKNQQNLLEQILAGVDQERVQKLIDLWSQNFIEPLRSAGPSANTPFNGALETAEKIRDFLRQIKNAKKSDEALASLLEGVRNQAESQVNGTLMSALAACTTYNLQKEKELPVVLALTAHYSVPVCEGDPDFRQAANVDQPIRLFRQTAPQIPDELKDDYSRLAYFHQRRLFGGGWFSSVALADGFEIVPIQNQDELAIQIQRRMPGRNAWQEPGFGVFTGFPKVQRTQSVSETGRRLFSLAQTLKKLRGR